MLEKQLPREDAAKFLLEAATEFAQSTLGQDPQYCPHPATWLNAGRWDDDRAEWQRRGGNAIGPGQRHDPSKATSEVTGKW